MRRWCSPGCSAELMSGGGGASGACGAYACSSCASASSSRCPPTPPSRPHPLPRTHRPLLWGRRGTGICGRRGGRRRGGPGASGPGLAPESQGAEPPKLAAGADAGGAAASSGRGAGRGAAAGFRGAGAGGACGPGRRRPWEIRGEEARLECDARVCFCDRSVGRASHLGAWPVGLGRT